MKLGYEPTEIGDYVVATSSRQNERGAWEAHVDIIPPDWTVMFNPRKDMSWAAGNVGRFRIYRTLPTKKEIWLTASDFGFLPISDRMRPRYRNAVRLMLGWLQGDPGKELEYTDEFSGCASEVKGMFNRCTRQDQWDWFDVWAGLGKPSFSDTNKCRDLITNLRVQLNGRQTQDIRSGLIDSTYGRLHELGLEQRLRSFLDHIEKSYDGLTEGTKIDRGTSSRSRIGHQTPEPISRNIDKGKLDYANQQHRHTLATLSRVLDGMGYYPEANTFIDLFTRLSSGPAIFEVKSISPTNELSQTRHAISQLYEYRYRHNYRDATLWLVLSKKPDTKWLVPYLLDDRDIEVLWMEDETLTGASLQKLGRTGKSQDIDT